MIDKKKAECLKMNVVLKCKLRKTSATIYGEKKL